MPRRSKDGCMARTWALRYITEHKLPVMVKGFISFIFFLLSQLFTLLVFPLSHTRVVRATPSRICMYVRAFFPPLFLSDVGALILWVVSLWWRRSFVLFLLPWQWVRRPLVWASGDENEGCFCESVVSFCGFGCVYWVCCYCLQPFITELK